MKYRLTVYPAIELANTWTTFLFETERELKSASDTVADMLLFLQDKVKLMDDYSNMFVKEFLNDSNE